MPKNSLSCKNLFLKHRRQQKHVVTYMATNSTGNKVLITPYWTYIILMLLWYSSCNEICIILGSLDLRVLIGKKQAAKEKWQSHNHCNTRYCKKSVLKKRSSYPRCSVKKDVLRNFAKFTGKHLCQRLWHKCFPVNLAKFLRIPYFTEHLRWLFLTIHWDKTKMLKKFPSDKIKITKKMLSFFFRKLQLITVVLLIHNSHTSWSTTFFLCKTVFWIFRFRFRFVFIKVCIFVQQRAWTLSL